MFIKLENIPIAFNTDYIVDISVDKEYLTLTNVAMDEFVFECESEYYACCAFDRIIEGKNNYINGKFIDVSPDIWIDSDIYKNGVKVNKNTKKRTDNDTERPF